MTDAAELANREQRYGRLRGPDGSRYINIRVLPELLTVARDMGDLFGPDEAGPGETLVRKGRIVTRSGPTADIVLAFDSGNLLGHYVILRYPGEDWQQEAGYKTPTPAQAAGIAAVLGRVV